MEKEVELAGDVVHIGRLFGDTAFSSVDAASEKLLKNWDSRNIHRGITDVNGPFGELSFKYYKS